MEPTSIAILPSGLAPAITQKLIAGREGNKSFAFIAGVKSREGGKKMELEELTKLFGELVARVETLEKDNQKEAEKPAEDKEADSTTANLAVVAKLEKSNKDLQAKLDKVESEKLTAEVKTLTEEVTGKMLPGQVEILKAELEKTTDLSEQKVVLSRLNAIIEEPADSERKLKAGRAKSKSKAENFEAAVKKEMADHGVSRFTAQRTVNDSMTDDEFETKEV
jgi:hypothetical protein